MTRAEAYDVVDTSKTVDLGLADKLVPGDKNGYYSYDVYVPVDSVLGVNMKSYLFMEFACNVNEQRGDNDILICYGYHIGNEYDTAAKKMKYLYSKDELKAGYDTIYGQIKEKNGEGEPTSDSSHNVESCEWDDTQYGDLWIAVGTDMWGVDGLNEIILSCSNYDVLK